MIAVCRTSRSVPGYSHIWALYGQFNPQWLDNSSFHVEQSAAAKGKAPEAPGYGISNGVATIPIQGVLMPRRTFWSAAFGIATMPDLQDTISRAARDKAVNMILLDVDSPGGASERTPDLADAVFDARKRKPVVAHIQNVGASAAYFVGSQADRVFASKGALVGAIGTYTVVPDFSQAAANQGIKVHVVKAGEFKGAGAFGTEITDAQLAEAQRVINDINENFVKAVARGRKMSMADVRARADGRVHLDKGAVELGLIDGVRSREDVLSDLEQMSLGKKENNMLGWK